MTVITARGPTVVTRDQYNRGRLSCSVCIQWRSQYLEGGHRSGGLKITTYYRYLAAKLLCI